MAHIGVRHGDPARVVHDGCNFYKHKHPDYNFEPCDWAVSTIGKAYAMCNVANLNVRYTMNKRTGLLEQRRDNKRNI